jgi:hypothetical protein
MMQYAVLVDDAKLWTVIVKPGLAAIQSFCAKYGAMPPASNGCSEEEM